MDSRALLVFAVIFCLGCKGTFSCPKRCTCHFSNKTTEVVCPDVSLSRYPSDSLPGSATSLTIQFTNLSNVTAPDLRATPLLKELHLPGNRLRSLPADLLAGLTHLHTIDLTGNLIQELPPHVFHHAPLLNLVLKDNLLTNVSADWLPRSSSLTWLDLSGNQLKESPTGLLHRLTRLEVLHLSQNHLQELPADSFHSLFALERLYLDGNKLQALDSKAFSGNANLTYLFLQKNQMDTLPPAVFHGLARLHYVDLSNNRLRFLAPGTLPAGIGWVDLDGNPWHCNAKLAPLWMWLNSHSGRSEPKCASPEGLKGRVISKLTSTELGLSPAH
ncbi:leucine-rich alpha-2-glycoprotein [Electrophorus electricus]|uniref:LRRCT domain-containing protein n=2 Tax=Electrophorus TaxID=8004 RepID=A0A4W4H108_ELEEL|nr:leucine-rich alpha-2-glycoprotein [Electrophorus electricus]XP_026878444.1 leucine-rich alpha-2-glycoprotein [Electrophorus electricus]XP_026878445.1 leucine-rich alpha-2-glycoprotein [Electrophorus electricus]